MRSPRAFLLATALATAMSSSGVSEAATFVVKTTPCKGYMKQDKKWAPAPELPFASGDQIEGRAVAGRSDIVYWNQGGTDYTVPVKCLSQAGGGAPASSAAAARPGGSPSKNSVASRTTWNLQVSGISWQEVVNLSASNSRLYPLNASNIGTCVGGGVRSALSASFDFTIDACGIYMMSYLGNSADADADITYEATGSSVLGFKAQLGALWHTDSQFFSLGVSAPITYRYGNWPIPPETDGISYELQGNPALATGIVLESRLSAGNFLVIPRAGILGSLSNFLWEIGFGYSL